MSASATPDIKKGLVGVYADVSAISKVMPETNSLTYRGYAVQDLCEHPAASRKSPTCCGTPSCPPAASWPTSRPWKRRSARSARRCTGSSRTSRTAPTRWTPSRTAVGPSWAWKTPRAPTIGREAATSAQGGPAAGPRSRPAIACRSIAASKGLAAGGARPRATPSARISSTWSSARCRRPEVLKASTSR